MMWRTKEAPGSTGTTLMTSDHPRVAAAIEATAHAGDFEGIADARMEAGLKTLQGRDPMEAET